MRCPIGFTIDSGLGNGQSGVDTFKEDVDKIIYMGGNSIRTGASMDYTSEEDLNYFRQSLEYAHSKGIKILLTTSQISVNDATIDTQKGIQTATTYIKKVSDKVGDLVTWWQVANEHDMRDWRNWDRKLWDDSPGEPWEIEQRVRERIYMDQEYLESLRDVIEACSIVIKQKNPNTVVFTAITGTPVTYEEEKVWIRIHRVITPAVDAIGLNLYPITWWQKYVEMPARIRRVSYKFKRPVLITEIGLPGVLDPIEETGEWIAHQVDRGTRSSSVEGLWIYQLRDRNPGGADTEDLFGIYNYDGTPKKYMWPVRAMIRSITS